MSADPWPMALPFPLDISVSRGHTVFTAYRSVNLVGVRRAKGTPGQMDDLLYALWRDGGHEKPTVHTGWHCRVWQLETEPGRPYLAKPMNPLGTAIMKAGQYRSAYQEGLHNGRPALVQVGPVTVYRDADRDRECEIVPGSEDTGLFGVNIHDITDPDGLAGCQGLWPSDRDEMLAVYRMSAAIHGKRVSYTLLEPV